MALVKNSLESQRAEVVLKTAREELAKLQETAKQGGVKADALEAAEAKVTEAEAMMKRLRAQEGRFKEKSALLKAELTKSQRKGS